MCGFGTEHRLIKEKRKQLVIFIPRGPGDPAHEQAVVLLSALSTQGHRLMARTPGRSLD